MGGSSLCPEVLATTFAATDDLPRLRILDSTDPQQITALEDAINLARTLFIVSSKSGTTLEPNIFAAYFQARLTDLLGADAAARQFIAITDPGTPLEQLADRAGYRAVFHGWPTIGGRYSALSDFGMIPGAASGVAVADLLDRAERMAHACAPCVQGVDNPGLALGAVIGVCATAGHDKLTLVTSASIRGFGAWLEQLLAESTGKNGKGVIPVDREPLGAPDVYGDDRIFVYVGSTVDGVGCAEIDAQLATLEGAGHPVVRLKMNDTYDVGEQFYLWEIATAAAGSVLQIDAFDQPNVQESKDNTKALLAEYAAKGTIGEPATNVDGPAFDVTYLSGSSSLSAGDANAALAGLLGQVTAGDYVALTAYIARDEKHEALLRELRVKIRDAKKVATTVGFGPRFLHSTGQEHKGGPDTGVFVQITADSTFDLQIPGMNVGFRTLIAAQALGDLESLDKRNRRGVRVHLKGDLDRGLAALSQTIDEALMAKT